MKDNYRTVDQIYSKWGDLNHHLRKFNGFFHQASNRQKSGEGDEDIILNAMKLYQQNFKAKGFSHIEAWKEVRYKPNWYQQPSPGDDTQPT